MTERHGHKWIPLACGALLLAVVGGVSIDRAVRGRFDFHHFYLDARYVWQHGQLNPSIAQPATENDRQLPFYLPVVPLALAPIAAFGRWPAAILWGLGQVAALGYSLRILWQWGRRAGGRGPTWGPFAVAVLLAAPAFLEAGKFNQLSYFVLALVLGGVTALECGRDCRAGALLAVAAVLKLLPGIFLLWLVFKRRWTATAAFVIVGIVLAAVPPTVVFGPRAAVEYHQEWWSYNVRGESAGGMLNTQLPEHFVDRRNQSIAQVLARLTWHEHPYAAPIQPVQLSPDTCRRVAYCIGGVLLVALLLNTRHRWNSLTVERRRAEFAVFAIGMLVFSPLLRQYYLVWAVPGLVLLARAAANEFVPRARRLGRIGVGVWLAGMVAWIWPLTRVLGTHLLMLILLGALLLMLPSGSESDREELERQARLH